MENCKKDSSSKMFKTNGGSYLDLEVSIFVKIFEFYLVTQSL